MSTASSEENPSAASSSRRAVHRLKVLRIVDETHDTKSIVFDVPRDLKALFRYESGQFLTLEVAVDDSGTTVRRCYSLASSPVAEDEHKVTVKRVAGGRVSNWVHDALHEGDSIGVVAPEGRFVLRGEGPVALFAGGSGITPIISLVKTVLLTTSRPVMLLYANRDARSVIFEKELSALTAKFGRRLTIAYRQDDTHGFLTEADVVAMRDIVANAECYVCGPGPFMETVERALTSLEVDDHRIHIEKFASPPANPTPEVVAANPNDVVPDVLEIHLKGKRHLVPYTPGTSLLKTALDAGLDAPFSCEEGFCGCCVAQLKEGEVTMTTSEALTDEEKRKGFVLSCQSRPKTKTCVFEFFDY